MAETLVKEKTDKEAVNVVRKAYRILLRIKEEKLKVVGTDVFLLDKAMENLSDIVEENK